MSSFNAKIDQIRDEYTEVRLAVISLALTVKHAREMSVEYRAGRLADACRNAPIVRDDIAKLIEDDEALASAFALEVASRA